MPHLHIKEFKEIELPKNIDGVEFNFIAKNIQNTSEILIGTVVDGESFFLLVKNDNNKVLLKTDKLTRPASIYNVHKALLSYAKGAKLDILSSNVPQKSKNEHLKKLDALREIEFFASTFPKNEKIRIEIGFGSGRHLLYQAKNNPDILFIGLEIHRPSIEQVLKQISIQEIQNILVIDYDARLFMELIPSNVIEKIYIHFPVPWDKKPHRRIISTAFIEEAKRVLSVGGRVELRTDSENYYAYSYETFISFHKTVLHINKNKDIEISSKYEDRWKKMEKNIYDLTMINEEVSKELKIDGNFEFSKNTISRDELIRLHNVTKKFNDGFVHFERIYELQDATMLRISMGSFDRPEHLYLIVKNNGVKYYPSLPLKSKSNLRAHKFLKEVLNG